MLNKHSKTPRQKPVAPLLSVHVLSAALAAANSNNASTVTVHIRQTMFARLLFFVFLCFSFVSRSFVGLPATMLVVVVVLLAAVAVVGALSLDVVAGNGTAARKRQVATKNGALARFNDYA